MSHINDALRRAIKFQDPELESASSLEISAIIARIVKHKRVFLGIFVSVFVLSSGIVLSLPKYYEAEMKLLVKNERQDLVISPESNASTTYSSELSETAINSEIELLRSRDVLRQVAVKAGLSVPESGTVQAAGGPSPVSLDKSLVRLEHDLSIAGIKKSNIIDVVYTSKDPESASTVLKALADSYLQAHLKIHGTPGGYAFFEQQANAYRDRLKASEDELKAFQEKYNSLVLPEQEGSVTTRSLDTQASLEDVDAQIADYQHRVTQNQQILKTLDPRVVTQMKTIPQAQLIGNLNQTLIALQNKRTELITKFRKDDRLVLEVEKQIADTNSALKDALGQSSTERQTDANPVRQDAEKELVTSQVALSGLRARRAEIKHVVGGYKQKMFNLADATVQHRQLVRKVKENEDNYLLYQKKREEARIAESLDQQRITNVVMVQAPVAPLLPSGPRVKVDIFLSAVCALFVALAAVLLLEVFPEQAAFLLGRAKVNSLVAQ